MPSFSSFSFISKLNIMCIAECGVTSTINDTWVNGTLINEGDKCVHAKIDAVDTYQLQWAGHLENFWPGYI